MRRWSAVFQDQTTKLGPGRLTVAEPTHVCLETRLKVECWMGILRQMCCSDSSGGEVTGVVHVAVFICRRVAGCTCLAG